MAAQGWCPSTFRLFDAPDGGLARVKVPGGMLGLDQVRAVATAGRRYGNGTVEITSRANLQIRGVDPERAADLRALLAAVGLSSPTAEIEDRRNVLASPTAGLPPDELVDVQPIVQVVVEALDDLPPLAALPHKFGVLIDGGGSPTLRGHEIDLALGAVLVPDDEGGTVAFEVAIGTSLPTAPKSADEPVVFVEPRAVVRFVLAAARLCGGEHPTAPAERLADTVAGVGLTATLEALVSLAETSFGVLPSDSVVRTAATGDAPLGVFDTRHSGRSYLGVAPRGRLSFEHLTELGDALAEHGLDEIRLTPWRTIVVPTASSEAARLVAHLDVAGWTVHEPALTAGAPA